MVETIPTDYGELASLYLKALSEIDGWKDLYYSEIESSNELICELEKLKKTRSKG